MNSYYSKDKWKDYGNYFIYEDDQRTIGWRQSRMGRVTGSIITKCVEDTLFSNIEDTAKEIAGILPKELSEKGKELTEYGIIHENDARDWYIKYSSKINPIKIKEVGFAVPKFDLRIGMSPDGIVCDQSGKEIGLIEIKCPKKMYKPILTHLNKGGNVPNKGRPDYIWKSHYDQMQMGMAVFDKEWCDYIVYCIPENFVFVERVYRDTGYWNTLHNKVDEFIKEKLQPILNEIGSEYPLLPC